MNEQMHGVRLRDHHKFNPSEVEISDCPWCGHFFTMPLESQDVVNVKNNNVKEKYRKKMEESKAAV